jgi:mannosyltransferase OCH1-like enzyme
VFSSEQNTLGELERLLDGNAVMQSVKHGILSKIAPSVRLVLMKFEAFSLRFNSLDELADAILKEIIHHEQYKGELIPRIVHHCWIGKSLSHAAMGNLYLWMEQTEKYNWKHLLWTDTSINGKFGDTLLPMQFDILSRGNIQIMDMDSNALEMDSEVQSAYDMLGRMAKTSKLSVLPYLSDLARYSCLFQQGGVYIDVDISPGNVCLASSLKHRNTSKEIPLLGPGFRTRKDARALGYYSCHQGIRETALLKMYNRNIVGNHFIATKGKSQIMEKTARAAAQKIMATGCKTDGPSDLVHTIIKNTVSKEIPDTGAILAETIPPWLFDIGWVSDESDKLVI